MVNNFVGIGVKDIVATVEASVAENKAFVARFNSAQLSLGLDLK